MKLRRSHRNDESGFTILYALGVLALLSTFALVFARVMGFERQASSHFVDGVRARLAARAGVERATAELRRVAFRRHYSDPWTDQWGYMAVPPATLPPNTQVDLITTTYPSFRETDNARQLYGSPLVVSGQLGNTYGNNDTLVYKLRVIDCAGQLNLNHPDIPSVTRMFGALLQVELGMAAAAATNAATVLVTNRPAGGFPSKTDIGSRLIAGSFITEDQWKQLQDDLSVHGWVDSQVIRPWNLNGQPLAAIEPLPRAPININTASRGVLTALFADVSATNKYGTFTIPFQAAQDLADAIIARRGDPPVPPPATITPGSFRPFRTWREFERWLDDDPALATDGFPPGVSSTPTGAAALGGITWTGQTAAAPAGGLFQGELWTVARSPQRDLIKAIVNPNTTNTKTGLLPNHGGYLQQVGRLIDKTDLVAMSTDGCLDAMGMYEITSVGLVLHPDPAAGLIVGAAVTHQVVVQLYRPVRLTTQEDFERHRGLMIAGNYIPNNNTLSTRRGMNAQPMASWPGMVSWPNYSLVRGGATDLPLQAPYSPASWDGYLTLTNIIANKIGDSDFEAGYAEGLVTGLKARAWLEPKDEFPTGQPRLVPPPQPPIVPLTQLGSATTALAAANQPRTLPATNPAMASVLDEGNADPQLLFTAGSQLLNAGVLLSPDRDAPPGTVGTPRFLAYDGQNLDLTRGASIRFWVQPLADPHAKSNEVLLSFVGSRDGTRRQVGFKVYKEALPTGVVNIVLEAVGLSEPDESGVNVDWNWATQLNGAASRIEIDVTPVGPSYVNDPLAPEWLPGSWHWVVVNIGPGKLGFDENTQYFASLQVDKKKANQQLFYKGNNDVAQGLHEYGVLLGHAVGVRSWFEPLTPLTINSGRARGWILPRLLGEYYHCNAGRTSVVVTKTRSFGDPADPAGPALVWQGNHVPFFPWIDPTAADQNPPGTYVAGPGWPSIIPFPVLSFNHRARLEYYDTGGAMVTSLNMWRTDPTGPWQVSFPSGRHPVYGPDPDVPNPEFQTPDGTVISAGIMTGGYPGDAEYRIALRIMWDEQHYTTGCQHCQQNPTVPTPDAHPSIEWDPSAPTYFENGCYAAHNSAMTSKVGQRATTHPYTMFRSWVRTTSLAGGLPHPQGQEPNFPSGPPAIYPITYLDDDCHGCESCDVDGPVFIGGEPAGDQNYAGGSLAPVDPATAAEAIFDNVLFVNGDMARRTDWPGANRPNYGNLVDPITGAAVNYADPAKDFEDRFFESNLATLAQTNGQAGQGAIYHRALLELRDMEGRLGTLTWTSYDTREGLGFDAAVWVEADDTQWGNSGVLSGGGPDYPYTSDPAVGFVFAPPGQNEGPQLGPDPTTGLNQLYVLELRLQDYASSRTGSGPIPAPLLQSPVFEDLTITVINDRAVVLHAEEGVEE